MENSFQVIEQAINKAVMKGAFNLAEVQTILQALSEVNYLLNVKEKEQSNDSAAN